MEMRLSKMCFYPKFDFKKKKRVKAGDALTDADLRIFRKSTEVLNILVIRQSWPLSWLENHGFNFFPN